MCLQSIKLGAARNVGYCFVEEAAQIRFTIQDYSSSNLKKYIYFCRSKPCLLCKANSVLKYILLCLCLLVSHLAAYPKKNTVEYMIRIQDRSKDKLSGRVKLREFCTIHES